MQLAYRLAKLTLCGPVAACSFVLDQQRMATGGHRAWPSATATTDHQQQQRHRQCQPPPPPHHAHCRGDIFSHCFSARRRRRRSSHTPGAHYLLDPPIDLLLACVTDRCDGWLLLLLLPLRLLH
uniref:Putative secreted protein n=1 Tax=Anopheles darlingi TaxID=43151 RepID=A0A2M4DFL3_ANODA